MYDTALKGLIDIGSSNTFIGVQTVNLLNLKMQPCISPVSLASTDIANAIGDCIVTLCYQNSFYTDFRVSVLRNLRTDIVVGHNFLDLHESLEMKFNGDRPPLKVCNFAVSSVLSADLFTNL